MTNRIQNVDNLIIVKLRGNAKVHRVRKLTGKPAFLTIADWESEAPRIHFKNDYAAASRALRIQSDFFFPDWRIADASCLDSSGVNLAENTSPLAFCMPTFGLPIFFFILFVYKYVDSNILFVYIKCKIKIDMANHLPN